MNAERRDEFLSLFRDSIFASIGPKGMDHTTSLQRVLEENEKGAGAYFTVNGFAKFREGDRTGRTKANVTSFNANFLDIDLTPETRRTEAAAILRELVDGGLEPTAVVLTGKGLHVYFVYREPYLFSPQKLSEYEALQTAIVEAYSKKGADRQARDAARVLRVPGAIYWNKDSTKGENEIELMHLNPEARWTALDIAKKFQNTIKAETSAGQELLRLGDEFDPSSVLNVRAGSRHHDAYSAALSLIQTSRTLAMARKWFQAVVGTWERPIDWGDMWRQFESAKQFVEKDRPQAFLGDPEQLQASVSVFEGLEERSIEWLWEGYIAAGKSHMLTGDPGLGKSQLTLDIAARLSTGAPFPSRVLGGEGREPIGSVILSAEDDAADTIRPRLRAAGADLRMVASLSSAIVQRDKKNKPIVRSLALRDDAEQILKAIATLPFRVGLVVIDPISAFLSAAQDSNSNSDARGTLAQLQHTVMDKGIALLMINHNNKNTGAKGAHMRSMGSVGWNAAARATFYAFRDKEDPERRVFSVGKTNLARDGEKGFFYRIREEALEVAGKKTSVPRVEWDEKEFPTMTADEYTQAPEPRQEAKTADCEAELGMFMVGKGEVKSTTAIGYMKERGFSQAEIYRAAKKLGFLGDSYGVWKGTGI